MKCLDLNFEMGQFLCIKGIAYGDKEIFICTCITDTLEF